MKKLLLIFLLIAAWSVQAREVYPLCDDWLFSFRYENSSDNARCVTLPHTWNLDALAGTIPYLRTTISANSTYRRPGPESGSS